MNKFQATISIALISMTFVGCYSAYKIAGSDGIPAEDSLYASPIVENSTDSIRRGPCRLKSTTNLVNSKKLSAYYVVKDRFGIEVLNANLIPESDNYINYSSLLRDVYYLEVYDANGIILSEKFMHN
ncbi:MAG: hypothetical protein ACI837_002216 [Crocinitomicaceae bacterium]|jgi:hypothetical protein